MSLDQIPRELRERAQWVCWTYEERAGKATKVPYRADGSGRASTTDPATWSTFESAIAAKVELCLNGVGYVFSSDDPFAGIDVDEGLSDRDRAEIIEALNSYTEHSVSGSGIHIIVCGSLNGHGRNRAGEFEVYDAGRFFVVTGDHVAGTPLRIEDRQPQLEAVLARFLPKREPAPARLPAQPVGLIDSELLERANRARNGRDFRALWDGSWEGRFPSQSEADLAFASMLAFWTGCDADRMDSLFRASGLWREKWDSRRGDRTYGQRTIETAIAGCREIYSHTASRGFTVGGSDPVKPREDGSRDSHADDTRPDRSHPLALVVDAVRSYMDMTDEEAVYLAVALAVGVAAELHDEEPLWLMIVGQSGGGKTEGIRLLRHVADKQVDELTRAGLLSWSKGGKKTGLLTEIPKAALVTISDFSTVITMGDREARARMFGMLRVVYDGRVYRSIGGGISKGADPLEWDGHLTLLAGATNAIDTHLSFEASLGERWLLFRLPESDIGRSRQRTVFSVNREDVGHARRHAQEIAGDLVRHARARIPQHLSDDSQNRLVDAAIFAAHARTGVQFEGQGKWRVPTGYPTPEEPMRLAGQLVRLVRCLVALGLSEQDAVAIGVRAACDSIPLTRLRALREVANNNVSTVASVHRAIGRGDRYGAKWELAALDAIGMLDVEGPSEGEDPKATRLYTLKADYRQVYVSVGISSLTLSIVSTEGTDSYTFTKASDATAKTEHGLDDLLPKASP